MNKKNGYIAIFVVLVVATVFAARDHRPVIIVDDGVVATPLVGYSDQVLGSGPAEAPISFSADENSGLNLFN